MGMNARQVRRWTNTRRMGRARYIWLVGVLGWGVATGLLWSVAMVAAQGWDRLPLLLPLALVGFPAGGYAFGAVCWRLTESAYARATRDAAEPGDALDSARR